MTALPKGTSLFWRSTKKRWVLSYADPVRGQPQKVLPAQFEKSCKKRAMAWAAEWLATNRLQPDETLARRRAEGPLVTACAAKWLELRERDERCAPATLKGNRGHLAKYILPWRRSESDPTLGETAFASLDVPLLRAWMRAVRRKVASSTARNVYYTFCTFYDDAMAEGWVRAESNLLRHPGVVREVPELETSGTEPVCVPLATVQRLLDAYSELSRAPVPT